MLEEGATASDPIPGELPWCYTDIIDSKVLLHALLEEGAAASGPIRVSYHGVIQI